MPLKLLDYPTKNPFRDIFGKRRLLAWPVDAYRVTLPKIQAEGAYINPFERVILKVINAGGMWDADKLEGETCIPKDLIQCILLRLQDNGFLNDQNKIIEKQRSRWEKWDENLHDYFTAVFFRELATGRILPFYHELDDHNPLLNKEDEDKCYKKIRYDQNQKSRLLSVKDVISVFRAVKRRSMVSDTSICVPSAQLINIIDEPELYYLACDVGIQKCDSEFRIADPFGNGFSLVLESAFRQLIEQNEELGEWFKEWQNSLQNSSHATQTATHKEPFDNEKNQIRYPKLLANLRIRKNAQYRSIEQVFAVLEWALFYSCAEREYDQAVSLLRLTNTSEHNGLLTRAAEKLGFEFQKYPFGALFGGKLNDFLAGKAEMGTVLGISLLMAESDKSHPFRIIAQNCHDFFYQIDKIKKKRNAKEHGQGKKQKGEFEIPEEKFMREMVTTLLPTISFSGEPPKQADENIMADLLLDARINIQREFEFQLFNRLGSDLQNRLIYAERIWLEFQDGENALSFVCDAYAALQKVFRQLLCGLLPPDIETSQFITKAREKAKQAGFCELPQCFVTVNPLGIRKTLQGEDQSLGACVVAFLIVSEEDALQSVANNQPSFLEDMEKIINNRGHGNEPRHLPKRELDKLRKSTYLSVKTLLEV